MRNSVISFIVIKAILIIPPYVNSVPIQELEVDGILDTIEVVQKQQRKQRTEGENRIDASTSSDDYSDSNDESDDGDNNVYGALRNRDVTELIQKANRDKNNVNKYNHRNKKNRELEMNGTPVYSKAHNIGGDPDFLSNTILEQLFQGTNQINRKKPRQELTKKHLAPNYLLGSNLLEAYSQEKIANLNNYSKIYIVLNPRAIQQSKSEDALINLISKLLSKAASKNEARQGKSTRHRYEGMKSFVNNDYLSRRTRQDSNEAYNPRDSVLEEYKPKRSRSDHGGSAGGRTAIPYIRHRGDIYERDN